MSLLCSIRLFRIPVCIINVNILFDILITLVLKNKVILEQNGIIYFKKFR